MAISTVRRTKRKRAHPTSASTEERRLGPDVRRGEPLCYAKMQKSTDTA